MIDKEYIFDHIAEIPAETLVEFIRQGIVTELELEDSGNTGGEYSWDKRNKVRALLSNKEPLDWEAACNINTVEAYQQYLDAYPEGAHREEARERKRELIDNPTPIPTPPPIPTPLGDDWESVDKESIPALHHFIDTHPGHEKINEAQGYVDWVLIDKNKPDREDLIHFINTYTRHPKIWEAQALYNIFFGITTTGGSAPGDVDIKAMVKKIKNIQADKRVLNRNDVIFGLIEESLMKNFANPMSGISKSDWVNAIAQDKNLLNAAVIHQMYNRGFLSTLDFYNIGIDGEFVQCMLEDIPVQRFKQPEPLEQISRNSTEIYFWGIPSSGKSCALGGILSVANGGKVVSHMKQDNLCQGYGYMARLMQHFKTDGTVSPLPEGTATTATYEMGFDLADHKGLIHPVTCIDLAGELIRCMFKSDSGEDMSEDELQTLNTLTNILVDNRTGNQKMHFFVVEYGADDRLYEGLPQRTYLEAAVQYIDRYNIFKKDTDAIFILVSKVDKAPGGMSRSAAAVQYLNDNYLGFVNGLKALCRRYEINGGDLEVLPFSLGEVCFQNYCRFQEAAAEQVVRKIVERSKGFKEDKWAKIKEKFSN